MISSSNKNITSLLCEAGSDVGYTQINDKHYKVDYGGEFHVIIDMQTGFINGSKLFEDEEQLDRLIKKDSTTELIKIFLDKTTEDLLIYRSLSDDRDYCVCGWYIFPDLLLGMATSCSPPFYSEIYKIVHYCLAIKSEYESIRKNSTIELIKNKILSLQTSEDNDFLQKNETYGHTHNEVDKPHVFISVIN